MAVSRPPLSHLERQSRGAPSTTARAAPATDTTLTRAPNKEAPMAVHQRNTASSPTQEPPLTIARVALYARVSTCNGQDPEMQLSELREYASRRGWTITSEYVDHGVSGSKESRPQLNQLMADAHRRKFDAVLVWKIDRFGRSLKASGQRPRGSLRLWRRLCQLPRQPRSQHPIRAAHVPDHRRHGGVRAVAHPGARSRRPAKRTGEGQEVRKAPRRD
jgi:hypothetical protein